MKRCSKCGETKPQNEFHKEQAAKDGLKSQCKDCRTEYQRSPEGKASGARYRQSPKGKAVKVKADKKYQQSEKGKQTRRAYDQSDKSKTIHKKYRQSEKGKQIIAQRDKEYRQSDRGKQVLKEGQAKYHRGIKGFLHRLFNNINQRCNNPGATGYRYWGGRGIRCLFKSFDEFFYYVTIDLGYDSVEKLKGLHIHRIENNGHYEPDNIEFLTSKEHKARHRREKPNNETCQAV